MKETAPKEVKELTEEETRRIFQIESHGETETVIVDGDMFDALRVLHDITQSHISEIEAVTEIEKEDWVHYRMHREDSGMITFCDFANSVKGNHLMCSTSY